VLSIFSSGLAPATLTIWDGRLLGTSVEKELRSALTVKSGMFAFEELGDAAEAPPSLASGSVDAREAIFDCIRRLDEESRAR
jgi:hypothetical protein